MDGIMSSLNDDLETVLLMAGQFARTANAGDAYEQECLARIERVRAYIERLRLTGEWLTVTQAADMLGMPRSTFYKKYLNPPIVTVRLLTESEWRNSYPKVCRNTPRILRSDIEKLTG